jgi:hyperosmotically inducible protein
VNNEIQIGDPTFKENVTDAWIVTKIKAKLSASGDVNPFNIDVDAVEGVVTLSGIVKKEEAKSEAERIARDTQGVKEVRNQIKVEAEKAEG